MGECMNPYSFRGFGTAICLAASLVSTPAVAGGEVGVVKYAAGTVVIGRGTQRLPAQTGTPVQAADRIVTGADGSVGIVFSDDTRVSLGPSSRFVVDRYQYDAERRQGNFNATLGRGRIAVVSGKIAKGDPDAMKLRTPETILGVRGTEFVVEAN